MWGCDFFGSDIRGKAIAASPVEEDDDVEAAEDEDGLQGPSLGPEEQPSKVMCVQWTCQDRWQIKVIVLGVWRVEYNGK